MYNQVLTLHIVHLCIIFALFVILINSVVLMSLFCKRIIISKMKISSLKPVNLLRTACPIYKHKPFKIAYHLLN